MAFFCLGLFCLFLTSLLSESTATQCFGMSFSRQINSRLTCGVFKTLTAHPIDCQKHCGDTLNCFSINTYSSDNGTDMCELVQNSKASSDDNCLISQDGSVHSDLKVVYCMALFILKLSGITWKSCHLFVVSAYVFGTSFFNRRPARKRWAISVEYFLYIDFVICFRDWNFKLGILGIREKTKKYVVNLQKRFFFSGNLLSL